MGGFVVLTEVDDLFGHEPLDAETKALLRACAGDALAAGRYDFHMRRKLPGHLEAAGFRLTASFALPDDELSFDGPARSDVLEAWAARLARMKGLRDACGDSFDRVRQQFLAALAHPDHRSTARVLCCVATAPEV